MKLCKVEGCFEVLNVRGICKVHKHNEIVILDKNFAYFSIYGKAKNRKFIKRVIFDVSNLGLIKSSLWHWSGKYVMGRINNKQEPLHKLILGEPSQAGLYCDHKDGNTCNYTKSNLRWVTPAQNAYNTKGSGSTGVKGVYFIDNKFSAKIRFKGVLMNLGTFATLREASIARKDAAIYWQGKYAFELRGQSDGT